MSNCTPEQVERLANELGTRSYSMDGKTGVELRGWMFSLQQLIEFVTALRQKDEIAEWQYQGRDGKWYNFIDERHRTDTIADGSWPIRALCICTPTDSSGETE